MGASTAAVPTAPTAPGQASSVGSVRRTLGVIGGAVTALLGGAILGEYPFKGPTAVVSGLLLGLVVAEVVVAVSRERGAAIAVVCAVLAGAGLLWAIWRSTGQGQPRPDPVPVEAWVATGLGAAAAALRGRSPRRREAGSPPGP